MIALTTELRKEINKLGVLGFDELNAPRVSTLTKAMLKRLLKSNKSAFLKIAKRASEEAAEDVKEKGLPIIPFVVTGAYVDSILKEYNPVTGYLYAAEADRKRSRLAEAILTAIAINSRSEYRKQLKRFADLWHTQTKQYAETMVDETRKRALKANGIKYVKWVTEKDDRVCEECKKRDGKIYQIDKIPTKPHYRCRCWIEPMIRESNRQSGNANDE